MKRERHRCRYCSKFRTGALHNLPAMGRHPDWYKPVWVCWETSCSGKLVRETTRRLSLLSTVA